MTPDLSKSRVPNYPCPKCPGRVWYLISTDTYKCSGCNRHFDVLSTETDHILYTGGPPLEVDP